MPTLADVGTTLKVRVTVTDDEGHEATFESAPTTAIAARTRPSVTVTAPAAVTEGDDVTFTLKRTGDAAETLEVSYGTTASGNFGAATGSDTTTFEAGKLTVTVTVETTGDGDHEAHGSVTLTLTADTDADPVYLLGDPATATAKILDDDDSPATGAVTVTGTPTEGETLTADTSGIADADGLDNAAYAYRWVRTPDGEDDADISGATSKTYVPLFLDAEATLKVRVTVTDDDGHQATFESAPTAAVTALPRPEVTVASEGDVTEGETVTFTLERTGDAAEVLDVAYATTASGDFGIAAVTGTAAFQANESTATVSVPTTGDDVHEANGSVTLTLQAIPGVYDLGTAAAATTKILDDDDSPATGTVTVAGTPTKGGTLTADTLGITDDDGLDGADYAYRWVRTPNDGEDEEVSGATSKTYVPTLADVGATLKVRVTVTDDEGHRKTFESASTVAVTAPPRPVVTVASEGDVTEGGTVTFTLKRTGDAAEALEVAYGTTASGDFGVATGLDTATFETGKLTVPVPVTTTGDDVHEAHGSVTLTLQERPAAYDLGTPFKATAAIRDDDNAAPTGAVTIDDTTPVVGETLTANVAGVGDPDGLADPRFAYRWIRVSGGAETSIAGATSASYTVVAADVGARLKVRVSFTDDAGGGETAESAETGAVDAYTIEVSSPTATENGDGTRILQFALTRSHTERKMELGWRVATESTAQAGRYRDFVGVAGATEGTAVFPPDTRAKILYFQVIDDFIDESDETVAIEFFSVPGTPVGVTFPSKAVGTILDDDTSTVSIAPSGPSSVNEGDSGARELAFTVSMDPPSDREVTVAYEVGGTAESGTDYEAPASALVTFPALSLEPRRIALRVVGDAEIERDETVTVALGTPTGGAALGTARAEGTIRNDDGPVVWVDPPEVNESDGRKDRVRLAFRLRLSERADSDVTVDYGVDAGAGTATAGTDFEDGKSGTVTIRSGRTSAVVNVRVVEDVEFEPDETVVMVFGNPQGAALDPGSERVTGTIRNDDLAIARPEALTLNVQAKALRYGVGDAVDLTLPAANGGTGPHVYALAPLPAGLSFDGSTRTLSGTPTVPGITRATYSVMDAADPPATVTRTFNLRIKRERSSSMTLSALAKLDYEVGDTVDLTLPAATGGTGPYVYALAPLPAGLSFDGRTRALSGTPTAAGVIQMTYNATDAARPPATVTRSFKMRVGGSTMPVVTIAADADGITEGGDAVFVLTRTGDASAPLEVTVDVGEAGSVLSGVAPTAAAFGENETETRLRVATENDSTAEADGRVTATVSDGAGYTVAANAGSAAVDVLDDDGTGSPTGTAALTVADAQVNESAEAPLVFRVTLSEERPSAVSVRYVTSDGSATAGADYVAASGIVRFEAGETVKTVKVAILEDAHDEGEETMRLTLSRPFGATIVDGTATGTIVNADAMPGAWLGRFGRTVAGQVLDAVEARMTAARRSGAEVLVAGRRLGAAEARDAAAFRDSRTADGRLAERLADGTGPEERAMSGSELLAGTSFALTQGTAEGGFGSVWGRGVVTNFDGRDGALSVDGEVRTGLLGADWARDDWAAGLIVSHSRGEGDYGGQGAGKVSSSLTSFHPWARRALNERVTAWGAAGYGEGTVNLEPEGVARIETDMDLAMAAAGLRGVLVEASAEGGFELAAKTDGLFVHTASDAARGGDGGRLEAAEAEVTRLRLGLEGTRAFRSEGGGTLAPSFGIGARHDGGDAETGFGVDVGAGVAYANPSSGVTADLHGRGLLAHEASGFREVGLSGSLAFDSTPSSDRGPSLSLNQTVGESATGGVDALHGRDAMAGLAADGGTGTADLFGRRSLETRVGYGLPAFGGRFTGTPELGFRVWESGRDYSLGWRLTPEGRNVGAFDLRLEATRREAANDDAPEHGAGLRARMRW